ncbi:unnamed protein product, partial [Mesorhabditis belari]|uniref:Uncharacterized protein n=1 Tax=Mesorhabditis belari TaxID=2138241 RepID=A0AAF3FNN9_9BILA
MYRIPFVIIFSLLNFAVYSDKNEGRLYAQILEDYEPLERPVENSSQAVVVKMGLSLQSIISVDEKNQLVDVNAWLKLTWHDYHLMWDKKAHGGVSDLRFKKSQIWTPDILMYNSADPQFDSMHASNVLVYPDGNCLWVPPAIFRLSCTIQVVWFPFDMQYCKMKFGSWTFDGTKLELQVDDDGLETSTFMSNGEWKLIHTNAQRNIQYYECCLEPYYDVVFTFVIHRRSLYYGFNLIIPCILITMLTLIGFTLPPDAGEKMSLQITIMLSICIFQNYVTELSPPTSEAIPFLGAFFALCMSTCAGSVVFTALALNLHNRNSKTHEMGHLFRKVFLEWLPYLLMMRRPGWTATKRTMKKDEEPKVAEIDQCVSTLLAKLLVDSPVSSPRWQLEDETDPKRQSLSKDCHTGSWLPTYSTIGKEGGVPGGAIAQLLILQQIYYNLASINAHFEEQEENKQVEDDWKFASTVVDRVCLFSFSAFILFSTASLFLSVPQVLDTIL